MDDDGQEKEKGLLLFISDFHDLESLHDSFEALGVVDTAHIRTIALRSKDEPLNVKDNISKECVDTIYNK